jgi:hypothetical protein
MTLTPYQQKLRSPQWQKRRLHLLEKAVWRCAACGAEDKELHVHHLYYKRDKEPWDYPDDAFLVVCCKCHEDRLHKEGLFKDLPNLSQFRVIRFQHADDFRCFQPLRAFTAEMSYFEEPSARFIDIQTEELHRRLTEFFLKFGWEGDGEINCVIVPPFFLQHGYSLCEVVFHVKQSNNGTSFIAIPPGFRLELAEDLYA